MIERKDKRHQDTLCLGCFPYVLLKSSQETTMGPITFWPLCDYQRYISRDERTSFTQWIEALEIPPTEGRYPACASITKGFSPKKQMECLIEAVCLWYFATYHQDLYYNVGIPAFHSFSKIALHPEVAQNGPITPVSHVPPILLKEPPTEVTQALSLALTRKTEGSQDLNPELHLHSKQIVRSIRLFVRCFAPGFENVTHGEAPFRKSHFKAETLLFLVTAFETLLDIPPGSVSDFKYRMRGIVHMMYGHAMELFWKWVDGLYQLKTQVLSKANVGEAIFKANPNFEVAFLYLGMRLFIYAAAYHLCEMKFIAKVQTPLGHLPSSLSIHREEIMLFFWPEEYLLKVIANNLDQWGDEKYYQEDHLTSLFHINLYCTLYHRYIKGKNKDTYSEIRFHRSPKEQIQPHLDAIRRILARPIPWSEQQKCVKDLMPPAFLSCL